MLLATFEELEHAQKLADRLHQADIPALIVDESKLERYWFMCDPHAAFHVNVRTHDFLEARQLVEAWDMTDRVLSDAVRCPECRSCRVEYPQMPRKFVSLINLASVGMKLGLVKAQYYCNDCHYTWPREMVIRPSHKGLAWPLDAKTFHVETNHAK